MIELGISLLILAALGVGCGIASIFLEFREEYPCTDYHKDEPERRRQHGETR